MVNTKGSSPAWKSHSLQDKIVRTLRAPMDLPVLLWVSPHPAHGPGPHFSPVPAPATLWDVGLQLPTALSCLAMGPTELGPPVGRCPGPASAQPQPTPVPREVSIAQGCGCPWRPLAGAMAQILAARPCRYRQPLALPGSPWPSGSHWPSLLPDKNIIPGMFFMPTNGRQTILSTA